MVFRAATRSARVRRPIGVGPLNEATVAVCLANCQRRNTSTVKDADRIESRHGWHFGLRVTTAE